MASSSTEISAGSPRPGSLVFRLNNEWHRPALWVFMVIVLGHWAEHLFQAWQIYVLQWPRPLALGLLGMVYPWMVKSELLHYGYAFVMLVGIWLLRSGFKGRSAWWWTVSMWIQFWHHFEHALLQGQAIAGQNLFGAPVPTSILQLWAPRAELHIFYNTVVFIPMVIGMYHHMFPAPDDEVQHGCSCAIRPRPSVS